MSYKPTADAANWEPPPGLGPWRELSDEEYALLAAGYEGDITRWYEPADISNKKAAKAAGGET